MRVADMFHSWKSQLCVILGSWLPQRRIIKQIEESFCLELIIVQPLVGQCSCHCPTLGPALTSGAIIYAHSPDLRDLECVNRHLHIGAVPEIGTPLGCMLSITSGVIALRSESWLARRHEQSPPSLTVPRWLLKFARDIIYSYLLWLGLRQIGLEYQELPCAILRNGPDSPRSASS